MYEIIDVCKSRVGEGSGIVERKLCQELKPNS
jgi:hypothetical protein